LKRISEDRSLSRLSELPYRIIEGQQRGYKILITTDQKGGKEWKMWLKIAIIQ